MRSSFRWLSISLTLVVLNPATPEAAQRYRTFCGSGPICGYEQPCGQPNQVTCSSGGACAAGYLVWDIPDEVIDCPGICGDNETATHGCYDPANPPSCSLCGGNGEPPCPSGSGCTPGCNPGTNLAGNLCYTSGCGGDLEFPCGNGQCITGIELQGGVCVNCGGDREPV